MFRELDQRHCNCATVTLEWDPVTEDVRVRYEDYRSPGQSFAYVVKPEDARLGFFHPFCLQPSRAENAPSACSAETRGIKPTKRRRRWFRKGTQAAEPRDPLADRGWSRWLQDASGMASDYSWLWPPEDEGV